MTQISQKDFFIKIKSSFTDDSAQVQSFHGVECLSSLFEYDVIFTSKNDAIDLDKALKTSINIHIKTSTHERFFDGIVAEISQGATVRKDEEYLTEYYVKIRPQFWLLTLDRNYLMFQEKNTIDIVSAVLKDCGVKDTSQSVRSSGKNKREYCVQYEESSFNFISRLLEEEGITYFFKHSNSKHTLTLADNSSAFQNISGNSKIPFAKNIDASFPLGNVFDIRMKSSVTIGGSALADYNYKISQTNLYKKLDSQWKGLLFYEYPGGFDSMSGGESVSKLRVEQFEFDHNSITAMSTVPEFTPGYVFTLQGHHAKKFNSDYVIHSVEHDIQVRLETGTIIYKNRFRAFQKKTTFRPPRITPKPKIWGLQSAVVVCPSNQEIYCDKYGCIKVHFHWDRVGKAKNTNDSSCWIRVAQSVAGNGWGALFTPRVGQEVLVAFSEGNPDHPIVVGATYNDAHLPLYAEKEPMKSSIKTVSYKDNEKGFNEMRFYDEKGKEEYYQHAQKDMFVEIENARTTIIKESNDALTIKKGNATVKVVKGNVTVQVGGNIKIETKGNISMKAMGKFSLSAQSIKMNAQQAIKMKSGADFKAESATNLTLIATANLMARAAMNVMIQGNMNAVLQANAAASVMSAGAAMLKGMPAALSVGSAPPVVVPPVIPAPPVVVTINDNTGAGSSGSGGGAGGGVGGGSGGGAGGAGGGAGGSSGGAGGGSGGSGSSFQDSSDDDDDEEEKEEKEEEKEEEEKEEDPPVKITMDKYGNFSLIAKKDVSVDAKGDISVKSGKNSTLESGANASLTSKADMSLKSNANMALDSKANTSLKIGANFSAEAKLNINFDAKMNFSAKANLNFELKSSVSAKLEGAIIDIKGQGMISGTAGLVKLGSMVKIG